MTSLPGDPDRLLVVEQGGTIQLVDHGVASTFLDLRTPRLVAAGGERGLLSVALAPDYESTHHLYVFFTRAPDGALEVDEFTASGDSVPLSSRRPLLTIPHPTFSNHNGGQLQFGPDGMLYIGTGDGGSGGDPPGNAQNTGVLLGKILRIDPHPSGSAPYTIPPQNPFAGTTAGRPEIWAYGLRNPWRFTFDRLTGGVADRRRGSGRARGGRFPAGPDPGRGAQLRLELPRGPDRLPGAGNCVRRAAADSSSRSSTTTTAAATARSSAATSSATRASATSTAATCSATAASARSAPWPRGCRSPPGSALRGLRSRGRRASARTPAGGST